MALEIFVTPSGIIAAKPRIEKSQSSAIDIIVQ